MARAILYESLKEFNVASNKASKRDTVHVTCEVKLYHGRLSVTLNCHGGKLSCLLALETVLQDY